MILWVRSSHRAELGDSSLSCLECIHLVVLSKHRGWPAGLTDRPLAGIAGRLGSAGSVDCSASIWPLEVMVSGESDLSRDGWQVEAMRTFVSWPWKSHSVYSVSLSSHSRGGNTDLISSGRNFKEFAAFFFFFRKPQCPIYGPDPKRLYPTLHSQYLLHPSPPFHL